MRITLAVLLAIGLCAACGGDSSSSPNNPPAGTVYVRDNSFKPTSVAIAAGTSVTWKWKGSSQHNVTFEDDQSNSVTQSSGSHQRNFPAAGQYRFRCTNHSTGFVDGMSGSVTVQ